MIIVPSNNVRFNSAKGIFHVAVMNIEQCCPYCQSELVYRDSIKRKLKDTVGAIAQYILRRLKCQGCSSLHREIPDNIQPYKHYDSQTIQSVIEGSKEGKLCEADYTTMRRWKKTIAEAEPDIIQRLASVYARGGDGKAPIQLNSMSLAGIRAREKHWLRYVMKLLINNGHKVCTGFAFCPASYTNIISNAGQKARTGGKMDDQTTEDGG